MDDLPPRPRLRKRSDNAYLHVREVKGGAWQARVWVGIGRGFSLNLGLFTLAANNNSREEAEWAAARASREFRKKWMPGVTIAAVVGELKRKGYVPAELVVPEQAGTLTPSTDYGPMEDARERRVREYQERMRRRFGGRSLLDYCPEPERLAA